LLPGNHRLFDIHPTGLEAGEASALMAILNSTLVGLFKHFYGRYAGSEGTLDTEIVDVLMIEIPSPVSASSDLRTRLTRALEAISQREVTHLVEQEFLDCHTEEDLRELQKTPLGLPLELQRKDRRGLDLLVFELLGVASAKRREQLVDQLYRETSLYYRAQRTQDIQSTNCERLFEQFQTRMDEASTKFEELAQQYAGSDKLREQLVDVLRGWFIQGKPD
jgi:hypothetical protein